jgi:beta-RFAP synthase
MAIDDVVYVEAAARLHFGVLDLRGSLGRWFGGLGAAAPGPTLVVSARAADEVRATGPDAARAEAFAARCIAHYGLRHGVHVEVHRALPAHTGLGSGTQLALAVARTITEIYGIEADAPALARVVGRAQRSAIGTWTFADGGLVVEGGRRRGSDDAGPLVARVPFPSSWRCVVALPNAPAGISGDREIEAFAHLPAPPDEEAARVAHLVLMSLLPAVVDDDIETFGAALSDIQEITGRWWAPVQGGTFTPGPTGTLVRQMREWGAFGVGQSSWGPAVYGILADEDAALRLAGRVREALGDAGQVYEGAFRATGARVWRSSTAGQTGR